MRTVFLIIRREYLTRVRKKSFFVMTFLGPLLFALIFTLPFWLSQNDKEHKVIKVVDRSADSAFFNTFNETKYLHFIYRSQPFQKELAKSTFDGVLIIPENAIENPGKIKYYSNNIPGMEFKQLIEKSLEKSIQEIKLKKENINPSILEKINTNVSLKLKSLKAGSRQEDKNIETATITGFTASALIYFFIFLYGIMVMRGTMEEKSNKIIEILMTSVKPFHLMAGKITGLSLVGLTQFILWVVLTLLFSGFLTLLTGYSGSTNPDLMQQTTQNTQFIQNQQIDNVFTSIESLNMPVIIIFFICYFLGGYFLYSALFAAIGAAIDPEADTQQFTLPVTLPLIFAFIMAQVIITNPDSNIAFWFSQIPLTSPVVMMVRIPFGVPLWEVALSLMLLTAGFIAAIWFSAKVYTTGILMYGKKVTFKELGKAFLQSKNF